VYARFKRPTVNAEKIRQKDSEKPEQNKENSLLVRPGIRLDGED
jgi:hypothetical protein